MDSSTLLPSSSSLQSQNLRQSSFDATIPGLAHWKGLPSAGVNGGRVSSSIMAACVVSEPTSITSAGASVRSTGAEDVTAGAPVGRGCASLQAGTACGQLQTPRAGSRRYLQHIQNYTAGTDQSPKDRCSGK